jgi:hypothetical protein
VSARAVLPLLVCGSALLWGCGGSSEPDVSLEELRAFHAYPLYYAGDEVAGNRLEDISAWDEWETYPKQGELNFTFLYGDCDPPEGLFAEGGCAPPVQIQNYSICERNLGMSGGNEKDAFDIRGAKASPGGGGLEIFTGQTTVVIFAFDAPRLMKEAIRKLRPIGPGTSTDRLPPPISGGVMGELPCSRGPNRPPPGG